MGIERVASTLPDSHNFGDTYDKIEKIPNISVINIRKQLQI